MKIYIQFFLLLVVFFSCEVKPEPIRFGKDACHHCKMTLMDPKFGAELVTKKGRIFIFDDVNCLSDYLKESTLEDVQIAHLLIIDFDQPETLIEAKSAFYIQAEEIKSPMASRIAAFSSDKSRNNYLQEWEGSVAMNWDEMKNQFK